jgi:hypothetical protein
MNHRLYVNVNGINDEASLDSDEWFDCFGNSIYMDEDPKFQLIPASEILGKPAQFQLSINNNNKSYTHYYISGIPYNVYHLIVLTASYYHVGYDDEIQNYHLFHLDKNENYTYPNEPMPKKLISSM